MAQVLINGIAFSQDNTVTVPSITLRHSNSLNGARWFNASQNVITWGAGFVALWDRQGNELLNLPHDFVVQDVSFDQTEQRLLVWGGENIVVWQDENITAEFQHDEYIFGARWNNAENRILSWSDDDSARIWSLSGSEVLVFSHDETVLDAKWSPDETRLATVVRSDSIAYLWDVESEHVTARLNHDGIVLGVAWSRDGSTILTWSLDGTAKLWSSAGQLLQTFTHGAAVWGARWNVETTEFATWSWDDNRIILWNIDGDPFAVMSLESLPIDVQWGTLSSHLLSYNKPLSCNNTCIIQAHVWTNEGESIFSVNYLDPVTGMSWNSDETLIAVSMLGTFADIRDNVGNQIARIVSPSVIFGLTWSTQPDTFLTWTGANTVDLWIIPE